MAFQSQAASNPPKGWTTSRDEMGGDLEWGPEGMSTEEAQKYGLSNPEPVLGTTVQSGDALYYFTSGGKLYLHNVVESDMYLVKSPGTVEGIISLIREKKMKDIELEGLKVQRRS